VLGLDGQFLDRRVIDLDDDVDVALDLLGADTERSVRVTVDDLPAPTLASRTAVARHEAIDVVGAQAGLELAGLALQVADVVDLVALGLGDVVEHGAE